MSAYIVEHEHINYLVRAALRLSGRGNAFRWWFDNASRELHHGDNERATEVARMLLRENVRSVSYRYPSCKGSELPGDNETMDDLQFRPVFNEHIDPVQVLKSADCYEYQSCEHGQWEDSEACGFLVALRRMAWHALPGYDKAEWGAPKAKEAAS